MNLQDATDGTATDPASLWHPWSLAKLPGRFLSLRRTGFLGSISNHVSFSYSYHLILSISYSTLYYPLLLFSPSLGEPLSSQAHTFSGKLNKEFFNRLERFRDSLFAEAGDILCSCIVMWTKRCPNYS